jgi:hypothetical protein
MICKRCNIEKDESHFWMSKQHSSGIFPWCKSCKAEYRRNKYKQNPKKVLEANKAYIKSNPNVKKISDLKYRINNKEYLKDKHQKYRLNNREKLNESRRRYLQLIENKLIHSIRVRQNRVISGKYSTTKMLGCSKEELRRHIENQFVDGMNWDNRWSIGKCEKTHWSIDHIIELNNLKRTSITENEVSDILSYKNLRPIWHIDNLSRNRKILIK